MEEDLTVKVNEPVAGYPMTTYADVMAYIHGINISREDKVSVAKQLLFEVENVNKANAINRLDWLATLSYDWDGYGASPVSSKVIENLRRVLSVSKDDDWSCWMISPESNGALCLQSSRNMSSISVGTDEFSYYSNPSTGEFGEDHVPFTPKRFLGIMRKIA